MLVKGTIDEGIKTFQQFQAKVAGLFAEGYSLPLAVHKSAIDDIQKRLDQWKAKLHDDSSTDDNGEAKNPKVTKSTPPGRIQEPSEISTPTKGRINKWLKKERNKINKCHITGNDIPQEIHSQSDILQSSVNKTGRNMSAKHLRCNTCDKILKTERGLVEHQEMHRSGPKTCPECGKVLHSKNVHKKKHKELLKCSHCEYIAGQRSWLEQHITAVHKKEQMYLCEICAKSFSYESVLKRHIEALHSSGELICCEYCEYSTKTRQCLKRHVLNKHTPNRPKWICDLCGNIFRSKAILEDHRYLHMGEKKFKCTKCDNTFSCRSSKNRHLRTVHGEKHFPCADCGKLFNDKVYLHRHAVIHTGEKNYACGFCDYCCNTRGNLRKHWRVVHKKKDHDIRQKPVIRLFTSDMDNSHPPLDENENKNKVCGGHQYSSGAKLAGDNSVNVACTLTGNGVMTTDTTQCSYDVLQPVSKVLFTGGQKTESAEPSPSIICEPQVVLTDAEVMISVDFQQQSTLMSSHEGQILEYRTLQNWSEM